MLRTKIEVDRHVSSLLSRIKDERDRNYRGFQIAKLYFDAKEYEIAKRYLAGYIGVRDNLPQAHKLMGQILEATGQYENAITSFKRCLEIDEKQSDVVLRICELYCKTNVDADRAKYWADRGEQLFPGHAVVFQLKEKSLAETREENIHEVEELVTSELVKRPNDASLRVRLLKLYMNNGRTNEAYEHAVSVERTAAFVHSLEWCEQLAHLFQTYKVGNRGASDQLIYYRYKLFNLRNLTDLHLQHREVVDASRSLNMFDVCLQECCQLSSLQSNIEWNKFLTEMKGNLYYLSAVCLLSRAKKNHLSWKDAVGLSASCYLVSQQFPVIDAQTEWYSKAVSSQPAWWSLIHRSSHYRLSQTGHMLATLSRGDGSRWSHEIKLKYCTSGGRQRVYDTMFTLREFRQNRSRSFFMNNPAFCEFEPSVASRDRLEDYDAVACDLRPDSLDLLTWMGLQYYSLRQSTQPPYCFEVFDELETNVDVTKPPTPESLSKLDTQIFLHASVYSAALSIDAQHRAAGRDPSHPDTLPLQLMPDLCTPAQQEWWRAAYRLSHNLARENLAKMRLVLQRGLETIRLVGNHGMSAPMLVHIAKTLEEKETEMAAKCEGVHSPNSSFTATRSMAVHYWTKALDMLHKMLKNEALPAPPERLFRDPDQQHAALEASKIESMVTDGEFYLATVDMREKRRELALDRFSKIPTPTSSYNIAQIYRELANEEISGRVQDEMTDDVRVKYLSLLIEARKAFYTTLDRLQNDRNHHLHKALASDLDDIESKISRAETKDASALLDETEESSREEGMTSMLVMGTLPEPGSLPIHSTPITKGRSACMNLPSSVTPSVSRLRPSPERLEAQIRALSISHDTVIKTLLERNEELVKSNGEMLGELRESRSMIKQLQEFVMKQQQAPAPPQPQQMPAYPNFMPPPVPNVAPYMMAPPNSQPPHSSFSFSSYPSYQYNIQSSPAPPNVHYSQNRMRGHGNQKLSVSSMYGAEFDGDDEDGIDLDGLDLHGGPDLDSIAVQNPFPDVNWHSDPHATVRHYPNSHPTSGFTDVDSSHLPQYPMVAYQPPVTVPAPGFFSNLATTRQLSGSSANSPRFSPNIQQQTVASTVNYTNLQTLSGPEHTPPNQNTTKDVPVAKDVSIVLFTGTATVHDPSAPPEACTIKVFKSTVNDVMQTTVQATNQSHMTVLLRYVMPDVRAEQQIFSPSTVEWIQGATGEKYLFRFTDVAQAIKFLEAIKRFHQPTHAAIGQNTQNTAAPRAMIGQNAQNTSALRTVLGQNAQNASAAPRAALDQNSQNPPASRVMLDQNAQNASALHAAMRQNAQNTIPHASIGQPGTFSSCAGNSSLLSQLLTDETKTSLKQENVGIAAQNLALLKDKNLFTTEATTTRPSINIGSDAANVSQPPKPFSGFSFSSVKTDEPVPVFGSQSTKSPLKPNITSPTQNFRSPMRNDSREDAEEFEPTVEFQPVVSLPDIVEIKTGEEDEHNVFSDRAKLYRFDPETKQWKERGIGEIKILKHKDTGSFRIIMRRDQVFKICANHKLTSDMKLTPMSMSDRAWCWNAADFSEGEIKNESFAIRFKTKEQAVNFKTQFEASVKDVGQATKPPSTITSGSLSKPQLLADKFKVAKGSWECSGCLIQNQESVVKCPACNTLKPGVKAEDVPKDLSMSNVFSGKPGFSVSSVGGGDGPKVGFTNLVPSATSSTTPSGGFSFGGSLSNSSQQTKPSFGFSIFSKAAPSGGFSLAPSTPAVTTASTTTTTADSARSIFSGFGLSSEKTKSDKTASNSVATTQTQSPFSGFSGFKLATNVLSKTTTTVVSTASSEPPAPFAGFAGFGVASTTKSVSLPQTTTTAATSASTTSDKISPFAAFGGFGMNSMSKTNESSAKAATDLSQKVKLATVPTSTSDQPIPLADSKLAQLLMSNVPMWECPGCYIRNKATVNKCPACNSKKPGSEQTLPDPAVTKPTPFVFTPVAKSNFGFGSKQPTDGGFSFTKTPVFTIGTHTPKQEESPPEPTKVNPPAPIFGNTPKVAPFSFGTSTPPTSASTTFGGPTTFSFAGVTPKKSDNIAPTKILSPKSPEIDEHGHYINKEDEDSHIFFEPVVKLPDKVEILTGEENEEVLFEHRAKLYRFSETEWKERGIGDIRILKSRDDNNRIRIVMRREQIHKICCNHFITATMDMKPMAGGKAWLWHCEDFTDGVQMHEQLSVRFKTTEIANNFKKAFDDAVLLVRGGQPSRADDVNEVKADTVEKTTGEDDVILVSEDTPCQSDIDAARRLFLPDNFYLYKVVPPCKGCLGCTDGDVAALAELKKKQGTSTTQVKQDSQPSVAATGGAAATPPVVPQFGSGKLFGTSAPAHPSAPVFGSSSTPETGKLFGSFSTPGSGTLFGSTSSTPATTVFGSTKPAFDAAAAKPDEKPASGSNASPFGANTAGLATFASLAKDSPDSVSGFGKTTGDKPFSWVGSGQKLFGSSPSKPASSGDTGDADDEVVQSDDIHFDPIVVMPENVVIKTGEEEETAVFCERAKLYRFDKAERQWKERGVGEMKILQHQTSVRYRLLLRRDQILKIACNHLLTTDLQLNPMGTSESSWCWVCTDYSEETPKLEQFAIKFKNVELAKKFRDMFQACQAELKSSQASVTVTPTVAEPDSTTVEPTVVEATAGATVAQPGETEGDEEDEDEDDYENEDEDGEYYEEYEEVTVFEKRATLLAEVDGAWTSLGMGDLCVTYDEDVGGHRISMETSQGQLLCSHIVTKEYSIKCEPSKKTCDWYATDFATDEPIDLHLRAKFSSSAAATEFRDTFHEGLRLANENDISKFHTLTFPQELLIPDSASHPE